MATGTVKFFNATKGFGFIQPDDGGDDVFAHHTAIQMEGYRTLRQGGRVSFEIAQGPKGKMAQEIRAMDAPLAAAVQAAGTPPDEAADTASL